MKRENWQKGLQVTWETKEKEKRQKWKSNICFQVEIRMAKEETEGKRRIKTDKKVYRSNKKRRKERKDKNEKIICF